METLDLELAGLDEDVSFSDRFSNLLILFWTLRVVLTGFMSPSMMTGAC